MGRTHFGIHDPTAVLALLQPDLFETASVCVDVETKGELTMGQTVVDWTGKWGRRAQTKLLLSVDTDRAHDLIVQKIGLLEFPNLGPLPTLDP